MLKRLIFFVMLLTFVPVSLAAGSKTPYEQTHTAVKQLFSAFDSEKAQIQKEPNRLKPLVRETLLPYIQIKYSGVLILGNYYEKASSNEREAYFKAFENYLVHALAQALSIYNGQSYRIEGPQNLDGKNLLSVGVLLFTANDKVAPTRLDFQWRKNSRTGEWKAYDMVVEGVSMISTKQNEWASLLRNGGVAALTKQLEKEANQPIKSVQK